METRSPIQSKAFRTTADPSDWVAMAKVAWVGAVPEAVRSRYWRTPPAAAPPGTTWLTDSDDNTIRNIRHRPGRPSLGSSDRDSWA